MMEHDGGYGPEHRLERLVFFSDAIFAIAITLLIIEIRVPALSSHATNADWLRAIADLTPNFFSFALSFIVIGVLWIRHHTTLSLLAKYDRRLVWPNLFFLMSVAFMPFPTALLAGGSFTASGRGTPSPVPFVFYDAALLAAALLKMRLTWVAMQPELLAAGVTARDAEIERRQSLMLPVTVALALALAFVVPGWNNLAMFAISGLRRLPYFANRPEGDGSKGGASV